MERFPRKTSPNDTKQASLSIQSESGFTYLETICSLFVFLLLVSVMVLWYLEIQTKTRQWTDQSQIFTDISFIQDSLEKEIQFATKVEIQNSTIIASYPDNTQIQFYLKDHKLIRTVRQPDETVFRGTTILSNRVQAMRLQLDGNRLSMIVTFISKTDSKISQEMLFAWGSQELLE